MALALPLLACLDISIDIYFQNKAILDGPLANGIQKSQAVKGLGVALFTSALVFLLTSNYSLPNSYDTSRWLKPYLLFSGFLIAVAIILFFMPFMQVGLFKEFYFPNWSTGLDTMYYLAQYLTLMLLAIYTAMKIGILVNA